MIYPKHFVQQEIQTSPVTLHLAPKQCPLRVPKMQQIAEHDLSCTHLKFAETTEMLIVDRLNPQVLGQFHAFHHILLPTKPRGYLTEGLKLPNHYHNLNEKCPLEKNETYHRIRRTLASRDCISTCSSSNPYQIPQ